MRLAAVHGLTMTEEPTDGAAYIRGQLDLKMVTGRYSSELVTKLMRCVEHRSASIFPILDEIGVHPIDTHQASGPVREAAFIWPLAQALFSGGFYSEECTQSLER
jgi:hypothetical protein